MALTLDASQYSNFGSSASVKSCLSVSCNDATDLGTLSYWSTGPFWSSTGYLHVIPNVGYGSFEAQVGPSCPQQGYFLNTSGSCVKCKLCDPNSYTPNKTCSAGAYQDDSTSCTCAYGYSGDGYNCWKCSPSCDYDATCILSKAGPVCVCKEGYYGDGRTFSYCSRCSYSSTTPGATCKAGSTSDTACQCQNGTYGDGSYCYTCYKTCSEFSTTPGASCPPGSKTDAAVCACKDGYYGDGMQCTPCSVCDANANATGSCMGGSVADVSCTCNSGFYGDGKTCKKLPETPKWIVDLAIAFGVFAAVGSILSIRMGLVDKLAKFETEAQFRSASKFKFRIALIALLGVCVLLYPLFSAIVNLGGAYKSTCSRPFNSNDALALGALCMVCLVAALLTSWCIPCHSNPLQTANCWGKISRFCRPKIGTLSYFTVVTCFVGAEI